MLSEISRRRKPRAQYVKQCCCAEHYVDPYSSERRKVAHGITKRNRRSAHNSPHSRSPCSATLKDATVRAQYLGILASALIFSCVAAHAAASAGATLSVSTTVVDTCNFSAAPMVFAPYVPGFGANVGSTAVKVACSSGGPYNVILRGNSEGPIHGERSLTAGNYTLHYTGTPAGVIMVSIEY